jgi:ATP-dependent protease ClpP protease subunit
MSAAEAVAFGLVDKVVVKRTQEQAQSRLAQPDD